jgi:hypothetical protein
VFYVDDGTYGGGTWTYLEVSPDIGEASWASFYDEDVTTGTAIGSGKSNTAAIQLAISGFSASAAGICTSYAGGGKNDWFLPSKDELNQIYQNRSLLGSFPAGFYWSSSEYAGYAAWRQDFSNGTQYATGRGNSYHVRAVRSF